MTSIQMSSVINVLNVEMYETKHLDLESGQIVVPAPQLKTMLGLLRERPYLEPWLIWSGNLWVPGNDLRSRINQLYFLLVRMLLLFGAAYSLSLVVTDGNVVAAAILMFSFFLTYASVIPGQYYNQYRIRDEYVGKNDDKVLDECIRITTYFVVVSSVLILYLVLSGIAFHAPAIYIVACFVQFYLLAYLAFNLLILLIDVQVASLAVDGLFIRCKDKTLDLGTLVLVRENIHGRVSRSKWVTGVVLFPCVGAILSIILIIFALGKNNYGTYNIVFGIANMFVFVKEVLFVAIAFWHVARVNGKADELTVALSKSLWCPGPNCVPDVGRLSVYASSLSEPISYKLLFRRISWSDVAVNALSVSVTLIVGVVKYLVGLN